MNETHVNLRCAKRPVNDAEWHHLLSYCDLAHLRFSDLTLLILHLSKALHRR